MHPIERLRYVARAGSAPDRILVAEAMPALAAFSRDPNALLVSLRQLIVRQPSAPGLLCLGAHMVHAVDPIDAGYELVEQFTDDPTAGIAEALAVAESGGTDVIDSLASSSEWLVCPAGTRAWIEHARSAGRAVVVVTPFGTRLPRLLAASYLRRNGLAAPDQATDDDVAGVEVIPVELVDDLLGPDGVMRPEDWAPDCPDAAEIARI